MDIHEQLYKEASDIANHWHAYTFFTSRDALEKGHAELREFKRKGLEFVAKLGTDPARYYLSRYLLGARLDEAGPIHYLLGDR